MPKKNKPTDVFKNIDMHGGDTSVCWEWTAGLGGGKPNDKRPYFTLDGKKELAYRVVYKLVNGMLLDTELVRHKCDNKICCNPSHLLKGSHTDNEHDKIERQRNGGLPHVVADRIRKLAELKNPDGSKMYTHKEIGEIYGVARETVTSILSGRRHAFDNERKSS